jgi:hypothetical protein
MIEFALWEAPGVCVNKPTVMITAALRCRLVP